VSTYSLAQLNIARMREPLESPVMSQFVANLDRINAIAEGFPGFVWRLKDESGSAVALRPFGDDVIVNMSVWTDVASLSQYAFKSGHVEIMRRRREWFHAMAEAHAVLWWVAKGNIPTVTEAKSRLEELREHGPSPRAFTFKQSFPPPDTRNASEVRLSDDACPVT
jgi:Domain of unknown function (DUF3291)